MIAQVRSVYGSARSYPATTNTMLFPATSISCASSGIASIDSGGTFWFAAVKPRGRSGRSLLRSSKGGYHHPASCTLILNHAFTPLILHKNRMRRRARTGLSGGRSVMSVPTGSRWTGFVNTVANLQFYVVSIDSLPIDSLLIEFMAKKSRSEEHTSELQSLRHLV